MRCFHGTPPSVVFGGAALTDADSIAVSKKVERRRSINSTLDKVMGMQNTPWCDLLNIALDAQGSLTPCTWQRGSACQRVAQAQRRLFNKVERQKSTIGGKRDAGTLESKAGTQKRFFCLAAPIRPRGSTVAVEWQQCNQTLRLTSDGGRRPCHLTGSAQGVFISGAELPQLGVRSSATMSAAGLQRSMGTTEPVGE